ncbi:dihydroorotate dehydrogenase electron transfer subunit [Geoglobus acetivorans]|uniref:Probable dihydroorotate dehydrogenase B (NAD(+)), electron transfer subunit n=1 Tax=Geoglobus acetivorans TaxID=565033 RepID=A0A0A7GCZ8_GEOAI|nr:Dihydroorotate dehydrogenase electron transfer subunit [Geoglobus acetivorans]
MFTLRIRKVVHHSDRVATLYFSSPLNSYPGQFIMLNVFDMEEIPLSLSSSSSVTVKAVGETTRKLVKFSGGELVGVRGPFGRPFTPSKRALIVAGGIGIAPMLYLYDYLRTCDAKIRVIYGGKTAEDMIFPDRFDDSVILTEDGSLGEKGTVTDALAGEDFERYERIYVCGPEGMIDAVVKILDDGDSLHKAEISLERYMKCGIGVCGSCVIENGLRVCADGPVFSGRDLK